MGIVHDAYKFDPREFLDTVVLNVQGLYADEDAYSFVRSRAIAIYDAHPRVRKLADDYGGWDKQSIVADIPESRPISSEDVAFWIAIILYSFFQDDHHSLGLGDHYHWQLFDTILASIDWCQQDREKLISGRPFAQLVKLLGDSVADSEALEKILAAVKTVFPHGDIGWLGYNDIPELIEKLEQDKDKLVSRELSTSLDFTIARAYERALNMLIEARNAQSGLCLILSG